MNVVEIIKEAREAFNNFLKLLKVGFVVVLIACVVVSPFYLIGVVLVSYRTSENLNIAELEEEFITLDSVKDGERAHELVAERDRRVTSRGCTYASSLTTGWQLHPHISDVDRNQPTVHGFVFCYNLFSR